MSRAVGLLLVGAVVIAACGNGSPESGDEALPAQGWEQLAQSPLSARAAALGVWTGSEVLVMGGEPRVWCPPNADCIERDFAQLADGAALDPITGSWRSIASAPLPLAGNLDAVIVNDALYVLVRPTGRPEGDGGFLRYLFKEDRWERLPAPAEERWYRLVGTADAVVAFPESDEIQERPDLIFNPVTETWTELPPDPLPPSFGRTMAVVGDGLYLFAEDLVANPGSVEPSLARVVRLDLHTGGWERRADSEILGTWKSVTSGSSIVFPWSGEGDGGETNNWGRSYPYGGIYETQTNRWSLLPEPSRDDAFEVAGVLGVDRAAYVSEAGSILELAERSWIAIPEIPNTAEAFNRTVVAAGTGLFVFGGEIWTGGKGSVLDDAYLWNP